MAKNSRFTTLAGPSVMDASASPEAHELFGKKTLNQVGIELELDDDAFQFATRERKDGSEYKQLSITHGDTEYIIGFSQGCKSDELDNIDDCMRWVFYSGFKALRDDDGEQIKDENDQLILMDGRDGSKPEPYLSLGLPNLNITRREPAFSPIDTKKRDTTADAVTPKMSTADRIKAAKAAKSAK